MDFYEKPERNLSQEIISECLFHEHQTSKKQRLINEMQACPQENQSQTKETNTHYETALTQVIVPKGTYHEKAIGALRELLMETKDESIKVTAGLKKKETIGYERTLKGR